VTPTLVLLDGPTGKLITADGRDALSADLQGKDFPWASRSLDEVLTGEVLKGTERCDSKIAFDGKVKGFYFSAHWVICFVFVCDLIVIFLESAKWNQYTSCSLCHDAMQNVSESNL